MASINDIEVFPLLIRQVREFLTPAECAAIVSRRGSFVFEPYKALLGEASSSFRSSVESARNVLDEVEKFLPIKDRLLYQANLYARDFGTRPVKLENSWINIQREDSVLTYHAHAASVVSGALYLKADERSSAISFCNPNPFLDMTEVLNVTRYTSRTASLGPVAGSLVLFPSWLKHGALEQNQSAERIVLSFNTGFSGQMPRGVGD